MSKIADNTMSPDERVVESDDPKTLADSLYKQNREISEKNKILSLLRKLYEISVLTLSSKDLAAQVSETVQTDLSFELVGILLHNEEKKELSPLAVVSSERIRKIHPDFVNYLEKMTIPLSQNLFLKKTVESKTMGYSEKLETVWDSLFSLEILYDLRSRGHIHSSIVYPLMIQNRVIGILVLSLNRYYKNLVDFERASINSFVNVVSVALDKALLYEQLQDANNQLKSLDRARAEFISIASHQLRTPPATIKWYMSAILSGDFGKIDGELLEALNRVQLTNNELMSLIEDMLNASRIERGTMEFDFTNVDPLSVVEAGVMELTPQAINKNLKLNFAKPVQTIPHIVADREKIAQVVNNFIDNAIKYTKEGSVTVTIESDKNNVTIKVSDTGKGMDKKALENTFEKYKRGADSSKYSSGLGLGLYVAKIIVEQHHGKIWAESKGEGKGSTFIFQLPIYSNLEASKSFLDLKKQ